MVISPLAFIGIPEIMWHTILDLSRHHFAIVEHLAWIVEFSEYCILEIKLQTNLQVGPEMRQSRGGIEMHIVRIVHAILVTLQVAKASIGQAWIIIGQLSAQWRVALEPQCAAIRNEIKLIKYSTFIPIGKAAARDRIRIYIRRMSEYKDTAIIVCALLLWSDSLRYLQHEHVTEQRNLITKKWSQLRVHESNINKYSRRSI